MSEILIIITVTSGAFIATNLDNLLLLVAMYARYEQHSGETAEVVAASTRPAIFLALVSTQLSNGTDTIIAFSALLADSSDPSDYRIAPTFLVMTGVFAGFAYYSLKHPKLRRFLGRYGQYVTPFILILVGFYILSNTASDLMPG